MVAAAILKAADLLGACHQEEKRLKDSTHKLELKRQARLRGCYWEQLATNSLHPERSMLS